MYPTIRVSQSTNCCFESEMLVSGKQAFASGGDASAKRALQGLFFDSRAVSYDLQPPSTALATHVENAVPLHAPHAACWQS